MLRIIRGGQRWLTALFVVGIGGVFVFFLGLQGPLNAPSSGTIATVGPYTFGIREFERSRQRRAAALQERFGDQFDAQALADTLDQMAVRQIVDQALLALEAEELGFAIGKSEIEQMVLADPGFRDESGRFSRENFEEYVDYAYGSQSSFIEDRQIALLANKMIRLLNAQPRISEGEARAVARQGLEEVRIAFIALGGEPSETDEIEAAEVESALEARGEDVRALYDERSGEFNVPEKVRARHILLAIPSEADEEAVDAIRERAEAALVRVRDDGEDFAAVATEISEDQGTKDTGGDLGFIERGQMVEAFEEAAFALEEGETSPELVRSTFGFHVIRVEERRTAVHQPFEAVREELARELLAAEAAQTVARETAEALEAAIREGQSLEDAARERELPLERSGFLGRRGDGLVPGLGAAQDLLAAAFALEPGQSAERIFEVGDRFALVQVLERKEAEAEQIEERIEPLRANLLEQKRNARANAWINARREALVANGDLVVDLESLR
jgi:peptidyl-prolyl cis-trans isomerase D